MTRLTLRYLASTDIPFADGLRAIAGWNQTLTDWQRFLDLSPRGCLVAECEGRPIATTTTVSYGYELGWIGMLLIHPDFRRRGIARVLMDHAIEILRAAGVKSIKLDATPAGREVYSKMGFKDEYTLTRFQRDTATIGNPMPGIRTATPEDLPKIFELDREATGAPREELLRRLINDSARTVVHQTGAEVTGFGMARAGSLASYLGPIVARDISHAQQIATALAAGRTFCDLPDQNRFAIDWATSNGFVPQRALIRMYLGENIAAPAPLNYFAIAAPELG